MEVRVQIDLSVSAGKKHLAEMRSAADQLTDDEESVRVFVPPESPTSMIAEFTMPKARQMDVADTIMRRFALYMDDFADQTLWFPNRPRKRKKP